MAEAKLKRQAQHEISHLYSKETKVCDDDEKKPTKLDDMCDNVIDIILGNLELVDLANISDTNYRLRNIAASIFSRRYGNSFILFDYSSRPAYRWDNVDIKLGRNKPIVTITTKLKIPFKLLRNFGNFIKFIKVFCLAVEQNDYSSKYSSFLKNLNEYILEYCTDSLEILQLDNFPFFAYIRPSAKLHEFIGLGSTTYNKKKWNKLTLELMPDIRSLNINCVPKSLERNYPHLERVVLILEGDEHVQTFVSFLQLNRQIKFLKIEIGELSVYNYNDVFSSIEKNLTQLKKFKINSSNNYGRNALEQIPNYRFKTVNTFEYRDYYFDPVVTSFEFNDLKKISLPITWYTEWMNILSKNYKNLKEFKTFYPCESLIENYASTIKKVTEIPEIKTISFLHHERKKVHEMLKTILGSEWKPIEMRRKHQFYTSHIVMSKFHRI